MKINKSNKENLQQVHLNNISSLLSENMGTRFQTSLSYYKNSQIPKQGPIQNVKNESFFQGEVMPVSSQNPANISSAFDVKQDRFEAGMERYQKSIGIQNGSQKSSSLSSLKMDPNLTTVGSSGETKFQDIVQKASQKYGVPVALINAVIKQESNFKADAKSHAGAEGLMQLMPGTAKAYGCENSCDPEQNIMAGTHFLSDLLKMYKGDVTLSLAGYNAGPGNVRKYGNQVPPFKETQDYVVKVQKYYSQNLSQMESSSKLASAAYKDQTTKTT